MRYYLLAINFIFSLVFCHASDSFLSPKGLSVPADLLSIVRSDNIKAFSSTRSQVLKGGCTEGFNLDDTPIVKRLILSHAFSKNNVLSLLGFCRAKAVQDENILSLIDKVDFKSFVKNKNKEDYSILFPNIKRFTRQYKISQGLTEKLSVLTAFTASWDESMALLLNLCDGIYREKISLTEALFILHMKPEIPNFKFFGINCQKSPKEGEILFYADCLAQALARVLKENNAIPANFRFYNICSDPKICLMRNIESLLSEYAKTFPDDKQADSTNYSIASSNKVIDIYSHPILKKLKEN